MAKKNLNPADAFRKAQRKKELKKNKTERSKARDFTLVKKDTGDLEDEIAKLEAANDPDEKSRLLDLKAELEKINRKKAEYVEEHPEHRRLVYRPRRKEGEQLEEIILSKRRIFDKNGLPRHPERSIYYDPVMNAFGVAPPGMPYMERPPLPGEVWSDEENDEDDVVMPKGPPPGTQDEDDDVDDIPMPEGAPPGQLDEASTSVLPPLPPSVTSYPGPPSPGHLPPPPPPPGHPVQGIPPFPPHLPPPPPPPPGFMMPRNYPLPPPPLGFPLPPSLPNFPPPGMPSYSMPPPPPGFFPRNQSASSMQDPLSSIPHQTFQAHRGTPVHPSLPSKPTLATPGPSLPSSTGKATTEKSAAELAAATVFAAPQLRDFKKEATAFVPTAVKRKRPGVAGSSKVNAAPSFGPSAKEDEDEEPAGPARPDLLSALKDRFGPVPPAASPARKKAKTEEKKKDDYTKFVEEMGDILGPTK
ncbi:Protein saf1 [Hypsizygus marmoreus]|uniref:Protein saf1 n=1 Tax=Hypsizygus marmoreus TaxID=39966 RepID=A0A369K535_HYPMA|nr:Protein saf1 [Hypsizygus marmoreus]